VIVSLVIPAFKASETISSTLASVFAAPLPESWRLDVLVVNDGSPDTLTLETTLQNFPNVTYLSYELNQGKTIAVNLGFAQTRGEVVIPLDADDTLVPDWTTKLFAILDTWPEDAPICFSACRTQLGESTVADPCYTGPLSLNDMLNERHMGEYLPMFRGDALRAAKGYRDMGEAFGCELWTYLGFAEHADLWISSEVLRIYHVGRKGSITSNMYTQKTAKRVVRCYDLIFADFEAAYRAHAPEHLGRRRLRQAVFAAISGQRSRAWALWKMGVRRNAPLESMAALFLIALNPGTIGALVHLAKKARIVRRFG